MLEPTEAAVIRVLIADDHPVVRRGLKQMIEVEPQFRVVAEASDGQSALVEIERQRPDIAVLDIDMPKLDGLGVAKTVRGRGWPVAIVFLTMHHGEDLFNAAMDLGSMGYLIKEDAPTEILAALRAVVAGNCYVTPPMTALLLQKRGPSQAFRDQRPAVADLSPTDRRILRMIAASKSTKDIATELGLHFRTIENRRTAICQKLDLHGVNALLKYAFEHKSEL
jgi:DNA-binding NarL/FixJ family response regulator